MGKSFSAWVCECSKAKKSECECDDRNILIQDEFFQYIPFEYVELYSKSDLYKYVKTIDYTDDAYKIGSMLKCIGMILYEMYEGDDYVFIRYD